MWKSIVSATSTCLAITLALALLRHPAAAAPVDVQLWGRTFRVDPRIDADEMDKRPLSTLLDAIPPDLTWSPGFQPSDEQVLAEVEERTWISQFQLEDAFAALLAAQKRRNPRVDEFALISSFYTGQGAATSPDVQSRADTHAALNQLTRGLRRAMGKPEDANAGFHFTLPRLPQQITASYTRQGFDAGAAYAGFRTVRAAYRSGDLALLARVIDFPLTLGGSRSRTIRNAAGLETVRGIVQSSSIRDVVARQSFNDLFVRDQGAMFGNGEVWIGPDRIGGKQFQIRTINPP